MAAPHDPDAGWKPNNRPQSTIARNFMSELDDLFKIDGGIDDLDKNIHQKKQTVSDHTQQLEALEARLKATEERLKQVKNSPPRKDTQRRSPLQGTFPDQDKARLGENSSPTPREVTSAMPGALPETPTPDNSTDKSYVMVDRPRNPEAAGSSDERA
ncbi:hypothetical protein BU24DRAFT_419900 [Aaosphaeria arxii CBS 175.79]|uniref:Uncharacterized protein n=1 Tax=Aaosphaeria arxii CBS 175.79 TaxID=1450172 RepID=A0A6A5XU13_9PLEO|nr:uncharacterized protein BU24DRAFT_419900 [Aaosphaeria arxii CBS 175.79]KAF2016845.1 hypothetical protein BU24DRAFT_419900 [Aaosphaeria arxii CBS 175.79]